VTKATQLTLLGSACRENGQYVWYWYIIITSFLWRWKSFIDIFLCWTDNEAIISSL